MTSRGSMKSIQRVYHDVNGRIESKRRRRCFKIIIDRFRYTDAVDPSLLQLLRCRQRAVPANDD